MPILPLIDSKTTTPTQPKTTSFCPLKFFLKMKILNLKIKNKKKKRMKIRSHPLGQNGVVPHSRSGGGFNFYPFFFDFHL
jgi:hypothetical protein